MIPARRDIRTEIRSVTRCLAAARSMARRAKWRKRFVGARLDGLSDGDRAGRPKARQVLTDAERDQLTRWSRRARTCQALALRSKIVLACAQGTPNKLTARRRTLCLLGQRGPEVRSRCVYDHAAAREHSRSTGHATSSKTHSIHYWAPKR
jgi:hypothetical protein